MSRKGNSALRSSRSYAFLAAVVLVSLSVSGSAFHPYEEIPSSLGWHRLAGTSLAPHCPSDATIEGNTGCRAVIAAWNGGVADTRRNRLIFWGGGHHDYFGNEVYALEITHLRISRLTDPSPVANVESCPETYPDGRPAARHTYNGLAYLAREDKMFVYGGSKSSCGTMSTATWTFDFSLSEWMRRDPNSGDTPAGAPGVVADYDPNSGWVFLADTSAFFRYDPISSTYKRLSQLHGMDYHLTGVIDPQRKFFLMFGGTNQLWVVDIHPGSDYTVRDWSESVRGCKALMNAAYPGLAYDPVLKVVVGRAGGDAVYLFDPDTRTCEPRSFAGGPGPAQANGTNGGFRYFSAIGAVVLINDWKQDAYVLRLTNPSRQ